MPTSVVVSAPSVESTAASYDTQYGHVVLAVVVEEHRLDARVDGHRFELAEPRRARHLDDDRPADRVELETPDLGDRSELVRMQPVEIANVPVQRGDGDDCVGIQQARSEHRSERVEVRVPVRCDDLLGAHGLILAAADRRGPERVEMLYRTSRTGLRATPGP